MAPLPIFINRRSAAKYVREAFGVRCSEKWLAKLAVTGGGPRYWKDGRSVLYRRDALETWVMARLRGPWTSSSDPAANISRARQAFAALTASEGMPYVDV